MGAKFSGKLACLKTTIFTFLVMLASSCHTISSSTKAQADFRDYANAPMHVLQFYQAQHQYQTYDFAKSQTDQVVKALSSIKDADAITLNRLEGEGLIRRLSIWDAVMELDRLIDESDPDFSMPNSVHALQSAEAIRKDLPKLAKKMGVPKEELDWFILVGLLHDIGKIDALLRDVPQWAVVGDSFPVGVRFSDHNIFHDYFRDNPDNLDPRFSQGLGVYRPHVGLDNVIMSYGHDEYAYRVLASQSSLPKAGLSIIRFHSFYPLHQKNAYLELLEPIDFEQLRFIREFSPYDLYSKHEEKLSVLKLEPFYKELINKYFPPAPGESERKIAWPILKPVG
jgi:inositol oxygenase